MKPMYEFPKNRRTCRNFMNQRMFSLQREFAINKDSLHPFLQEFSQALLDNLFNRPEAAPVNP